MDKPKKRNQFPALVVTVLLVCALATGCGGKSESQQKTSRKTKTSSQGHTSPTAREAVGVATPLAHKWKGDATLVSVTTMLKANPDGTSDRWVVTYNSAGARKSLDVHVVAGGKVLQEITSHYKPLQPIPSSWMDSTKAISIAKGQLQGKKVKTYWMGLALYQGKPCWSVKCRFNRGTPLWVEVNASSGKVIKTWRGY